MYADDIAIILTRNKMERVIHALQATCSKFDMVINARKSGILWIKKNNKTTPAGSTIEGSLVSNPTNTWESILTAVGK